MWWRSEFPCLSRFKLDNQVIGRVRSHAKCLETNKKKDAVKYFLAELIISVNNNNLNLTKKNTCILSVQEEVTNVEVLDVLYLVRANRSFASINGNAKRYCLMFSKKNPVASAFPMCGTIVRVACMIKFDIAKYSHRKLIKDVADTAFSFFFDETNNSQIKKQYAE